MKIEGGSKGVERSAGKPAERPGESKGFGQLMREKKASLEAPAPLPAAPILFAQLPVIQSEETAGAAPVQPAVVEALAGEIEARIDVAGPHEVRIEFNSQVLGGVTVHLTRDGGDLHVRLSSATEQTRHVLEANAESLRESLERRGYQPSVRVEARREGDGEGRRQRQREAEEHE